MATNRMRGDPDAGIRDLIVRLSDDSKRLMGDEVRLAKLELRENLISGGKGALWLGVAFGTGLVAVAMLTLLLTTLIGRFAGGHMWIGALVTGVLELVLAALLIKRGLSTFTEPSYSLEQTRESLQNIA
ncbi:MAG TPA: phage holin family protein [Gemmatimonadaceae bacterium]